MREKTRGPIVVSLAAEAVAVTPPKLSVEVADALCDPMAGTVLLSVVGPESTIVEVKTVRVALETIRAALLHGAARMRVTAARMEVAFDFIGVCFRLG